MWRKFALAACAATPLPLWYGAVSCDGQDPIKGLPVYRMADVAKHASEDTGIWVRQLRAAFGTGLERFMMHYAGCVQVQGVRHHKVC